MVWERSEHLYNTYMTKDQLVLGQLFCNVRLIVELWTEDEGLERQSGSETKALRLSVNREEYLAIEFR